MNEAPIVTFKSERFKPFKERSDIHRLNAMVVVDLFGSDILEYRNDGGIIVGMAKPVSQQTATRVFLKAIGLVSANTKMDSPHPDFSHEEQFNLADD